MKAKNRCTWCCSNSGTERVQLIIQLIQLHLSSLLLCSFLVVAISIMTTRLDNNNNKMQVQAFVAPPAVRRTNHHQQKLSSSSTTSTLSPLAVFGRLPTAGAHYSEKGGSNGIEKATTMSRRRSLIITATAAVMAKAVLLPLVAEAAVMENTQTAFKVGEAISINAAKARLVEARESLQYLVDNYDDIVKKGGGDNVRRYLGSVGTSSGLYGISKVLKTLQEEATDNIVEYTELANDFEQALHDADTACYSAIFVEYSAANTKPEKFFNDAKNDVARMQKYLDELTAQLNL